MPSIKLTNDPIVKRLRWVVIGVILFSVVNTLLGQRKSFWHDPETAIRGDGLSIYNQTNHTFEFFLGHGWQAYLAASVIYLSAAFLLVSLLPRMAALVASFSFIFGHYFGGSNWLDTRWHLGASGTIVYGLVLSAIVVPSAFPTIGAEAYDSIVRRLRWVMLAAMAVDFSMTLLGQPHSYWLHPDRAHEANQLFRIFMDRGWAVYVLFDLFYLAGTFRLVSVLPRMSALICIFAFLFGHVRGLSTWMFYRWRMGMESPVACGVLVSVAIVILAFPSARRLRHNRRTGAVQAGPDPGPEGLRCWQTGC